MDAFTEKILARARERQKMLEVYTSSDDKINNCDCSEPKLKDRKESLSESSLPQTIKASPLRENNSENNLPRFSRQNSRTRVSSDIPGSPKTQLKTLNIQQDNFNMEIKVTSIEDVRVEIEIGEQEDSENPPRNIASSKGDCGLRNESKNKLKQLGKLYAGGDECDISSPIHKTEAKFYEQSMNSDDVEPKIKNIPLKSPGTGLKKLAHLAQAINQWEDDIHSTEKKTECKKSLKQKAPQPPNDVSSVQTYVSTKTSVKPKAPQPPNSEEPIKGKENFIPKKEEVSTQLTTAENSSDCQGVEAKKINWDKNILKSLESQGFTRTDSNSRLVYTYSSKDANSDVKIAHKSSVNKQYSNVIPEDEEDIGKPQHEEKKLQSESFTSQIVSKFESTNGNKKTQDSPTKAKIACTPNSPSKYKKSGSVADKAAIFEVSSPSKTNKDPALLSVSERKALFEKNKGEVLVPKAAFGMAAPVKVESVMQAPKTKIISESTSFANKSKDKFSKPTNDFIEVTKTEKKTTTEVSLNKNESIPKEIQSNKPVVHDIIPKSPQTDSNFQSGGIASRVAALMKNKSTISEEQIESCMKSQRQKDMDMLLNRFHKNKKVSNEPIIEEESDDEECDATEETAMLPDKGAKVVIDNEAPRRKSAEKRKSGGKICSTEDSPVVAAILEDVKRIKVSPAKAGRLYPNLSDIEATTETDTDIQTRTPSPEDQNSSFGEDDSESDGNPNTSFGRDILETVCKNQLTPIKRPILDESTASDLSSILEDDYLDDLSNDDNTTSPGPTPPKQICHKTPQKTEMQSSSSFNYKSFNTPNKFENNFASPLKSPPKKSSDVQQTYVVEGDNVLPLTHTVSFYRKQQNQVHTPVRQITRLPSTEESPSEESLPEEAKAVEQKIREMKEEVHKQQNIIAQTSQALNLCSSTPEFSGSTEQVEAERVLLLASHRRQAALHELQRLKVENSLRPQSQIGRNVPLEKGTLTISNIVLPLKQKYVKALAAAGGKGHHVVCLIKCGEQVVPTKLVSTVISNATNPDTDLTIPGSIVLKNIYSDFTITFEVYCLQAQEEYLPHEVKYHINKKGSNKLVTPKKSKQDSRMVMPIKESPAGPQAVRSSSFAMMGYIVFSVQAINKKVWSLNNTPPMSPLDGTVEMRISCELAVSVEHRGFLTMFEDVSGFGAWHRRWCLLTGQGLSYWKYPDDEKKKAPIDTIDLNTCITKNVGPVSRDICARLHTFLIETGREALPHDKDSLITVRKGDKTIIRHLLSADTKEERIEWCGKFNAALTALRMWGKSQ